MARLSNADKKWYHITIRFNNGDEDLKLTLFQKDKKSALSHIIKKYPEQIESAFVIDIREEK